jgi:nanoRNase/pAp phosphatase (c-di-AMP/oligoRNAs hydrolase)
VSEKDRLGDIVFEGDSRPADSAARVIYEYYKGPEKLPRFAEMITQVDKVDSAKLSIDEIQNPSGWILLGFIMDPRTGLGRFHDYRISNYQLMEMLIGLCASQGIDEILRNPDVVERITIYKEQDALFREMVKKVTRIDGNVIISDLRGVETIYTGNRFMIYSMYPEQNISIWATDGRGKQNCPIAVGHSILNRTSKTNVGALMLKHGGGGHPQVGTCQVPYGDADKVLAEIVEVMKKDG